MLNYPIKYRHVDGSQTGVVTKGKTPDAVRVDVIHKDGTLVEEAFDYNPWTVKDVERFISDGTWIVEPTEQPTIKSIKLDLAPYMLKLNKLSYASKAAAEALEKVKQAIDDLEE